jgi:ATP-binding cassette subfamily B protein
MNVKKPSLLSILKPYRWSIIVIVFLAFLQNGLNLVVPRIISNDIDSLTLAFSGIRSIVVVLSVISLIILVIAYIQSMAQTYTAERIARDLRTQLMAKISRQPYTYIEKVTSAKLLTNVTSDIDAIKVFVAQSLVAVISSILLIIGASILLLITNWRLALPVLVLLPVVTVSFGIIFAKLGPVFKKRQTVIDWLNRVINENILGSSLVRVINAQIPEYHKFLDANNEARSIGISITSMFAVLIPIIALVTNLASLVILVLGGHFVIMGSMTLGAFTAFNAYLGILIFPIIIIGFSSTSIGQASASYARIFDTLNAEELPERGKLSDTIKGEVVASEVTFSIGEKAILKEINFKALPGTKTAIIGPTAAGKTSLLYLLIGLIQPTNGSINYDNIDLNNYSPKNIHAQVGFVFQDSSMFNLSIRENIAFSDTVTDYSLSKAIETAELTDFINGLPQGLNTLVSERGTSLSGGQKQRIMLARALALNPKVLLLDDFTARVDRKTETKILANIQKNYPDITLISVTQKIGSVEHYDNIVVLMEGEILAEGTHSDLLSTSPEYVQIVESQRSTNSYDELHT